MNQWVATKKWLLFMNLGPVVFVSNREVKRLATMFYSRSTNHTLTLGSEFNLRLRLHPSNELNSPSQFSQSSSVLLVCSGIEPALKYSLNNHGYLTSHLF